MADLGTDIPVLKPGIDIAKPGNPQPAIDEATQKLYEDCLPKTVQILTNHGAGSGFFMDKDGKIGTAAHVVLGSKEQFAITSDGTRYKLEIEKLDDVNDVAIMRPLGFKPGSHPVAEMGSTKDLKADQQVFPIGHPGGLRPAYISPGYFRDLLSQEKLFTNLEPEAAGEIKEGLQTLTPKERPDVEAALARDLWNGKVHIRPGDSGGPTFDANGKVIGVNDMITSFEMGYFVPVERIKELYDSKDSKFEFTYNRLAQPWAQDYKNSWKYNPIEAATNTTLAGGLSYIGYQVMNRYPKSLGLGIAAAEGLRTVSDVSSLLSSTDHMDRLKYGISSVADLSGTVGALAFMSSRYRVGGAVGLAVGLGARLAADFIPNRLSLTDIRRTDGSILPPLDGNLEKTLGIGRGGK